MRTLNDKGKAKKISQKIKKFGVSSKYNHCTVLQVSNGGSTKSQKIIIFTVIGPIFGFIPQYHPRTEYFLYCTKLPQDQYFRCQRANMSHFFYSNCTSDNLIYDIQHIQVSIKLRFVIFPLTSLNSLYIFFQFELIFSIKSVVRSVRH